jgi:hypothetical protein
MRTWLRRRADARPAVGEEQAQTLRAPSPPGPAGRTNCAAGWPEVQRVVAAPLRVVMTRAGTVRLVQTIAGVEETLAAPAPLPVALPRQSRHPHEHLRLRNDLVRSHLRCAHRSTLRQRAAGKREADAVTPALARIVRSPAGQIPCEESRKNKPAHLKQKAHPFCATMLLNRLLLTEPPR